MKKALLCCLSAAALVFLSCGCTASSSETSVSRPSSSAPAASSDGSDSTSSAPVNPPANAVSYTVQAAKTPSVSPASAAAPLSVGDWGTAAKYCTETGEYVDVPFRIVSVRRGAAVTEEVRRLTEAENGFFLAPEQQEEYAIAEYEICLDGFPVGRGGTLCDITAFITGANGEAPVTNDGTYWGAAAVCLDTSAYYYEGTVHSLMAFRLLKNHSDYLIAAGEYDETQTFFNIQ